MDSLAPTTRAMVFAAAGVALLGVVLPLQLRTRALLKHGVKVQGTVVGAEEKTGRGSDNLPYRTYHPVVRFTTTDGRTVTFASGLGVVTGEVVDAADGGRPPRAVWAR